MSAGFLKQNIPVKAPIVDNTFTNSICYGATGTGKTTCFILPNIEEKIKNEYGVLIYDFKGNLSAQVKVLADKYGKLNKVYEIGKPWGVNIDILDGITSRAIEAIFKSLRTRSDAYWTNAARDLFENLYKLLYESHKAEKILKSIVNDTTTLSKYEPKLNRIYSFIKSSESIVDFFIDIKDHHAYLDNKLKKYLQEHHAALQESVKLDCNKFLNHLKKAQEYRESLSEYHNMKNNGEVGGKNGVLNVLNSVLVSASQNEYFTTSDIDIATELNRGAIIVINVQELNDTLLNMLNITIYQKLNLRTILKKKTPITIFIDEAQKVLSSGYLPDVDVCRENEFDYVFSTQDYSLLESTLGKDKAYELLRNVKSQYSFQTINVDTSTDTLNKFEYLNLITKQKNRAKPIFMEDEKLFDVEYKFQSKLEQNIFPKRTSKGKEIIVFNPILIHNNEVIVRDINGNEKIVELHNQENLLETYLTMIKKTPPLETTSLEKELKDIILSRSNNINIGQSEDIAFKIEAIVNNRLQQIDNKISKHTTALSFIIEDIKRLKG